MSQNPKESEPKTHCFSLCILESKSKKTGVEMSIKAPSFNLTNRPRGVFKVLASLFNVALFLVALPLQVPLSELFHKRIGPLRPQEHGVGLGS